MADAANEFLKTKAPTEEGAWSWDPSKIACSEAQGEKGSYERSEDISNPEFKAMLKDLGEHSGKLTRDGVFYWTFQMDPSLEGRRHDIEGKE